jgi:hypothetical protein
MESPVVVTGEPVMSPKNFPNAVVYALQCIDNYYYIGSTINDPRYRLNNHKQDSKKCPDRYVYKHINEIGWDHVQLQVVEAYPCDTKEELKLKEDEMIKQSLEDEYCLNHIRAAVSKEERKENIANYYLTHRQQILEQHKEYLQANKDKVDAYHANYRKENAEERAAYSRQYITEHPEEVRATKKAYYEANKTVLIEKQKEYFEENRDTILLRKKEWAENNVEKVSEARKRYAEENKELIQARGKEYYEKNKDIIQEKFKVYREAHKDKMKEYGAAYRAQNSDKLSESHTCECGGKYTTNHGKIHMESKRHKKFIAASS